MALSPDNVVRNIYADHVDTIRKDLNNLLKAVEDDYLELPDLLREYVGKLDVLPTGGREGAGPLGGEYDKEGLEALTDDLKKPTSAEGLNEILAINQMSSEMAALMMQLVEINSGKDIDESIADGTLADDVKAAHERFMADVETVKAQEEDLSEADQVVESTKEMVKEAIERGEVSPDVLSEEIETATVEAGEGDEEDDTNEPS